MRPEGTTRKFGDTSARLRAAVDAYEKKIESGEIKLPRDADGNIIPSPSVLEPHPIRDLGLLTTEDNGGE